ncbi:MAG: hypothetical protein ACHQ5A_01080 [Opitutales bacterium]
MTSPQTPALTGPIFNQDSTDFFFNRPRAEMNGPGVDAFIDRYAQAGAGTFLSCGNAMKANFRSGVWESDWTGYDPAGPDDQPVLRDLSAASVAPTRQRLDAAKHLADLGINFHARAFARCRHHGIGAWMTVRMNDLHACMDADSSLLSTFFKEQRAAGKLRAQHRDRFWMDRALDWERPEVQEHYFKFVQEQLTTLDLDGIELDWMRFPAHFRPGRELAGGRALTQWMQRVRALCAQAAQRLGHPVRLGVRVPTRPETARRAGLDGVAWARAGLIDLLTVAPFWATADFDVPVAEWRRLLEGTKVHLAVSVEVRYQPTPTGPARYLTAALASGLATTFLHGGADFVYLFNIFPTGQGVDREWGQSVFDETLRSFRNLAEVAARERVHAVAYHDYGAPGEPSAGALPATDRKCDQPSPPGFAFRMQTGPKPEPGRRAELRVGWASPGPKAADVRAYVNGQRVTWRQAEGDVWFYDVETGSLEDEAQVIELEAPGEVTVVRLELAISARN